ncbi:transporter substrate-binding domain-containing protein [Pseudomonas taiwanensis]|uniref:Transporter substrate-binding domain-containing protein n=1 Tax=Pseudomonas taiwanensis TaxID=470150 RepID=A0ABR6V8P1_9PSED|nr:transporter substrate-binding domain-containing protein [Pseudomonas taiwanensis]MBC3476675.1 transporter substrate-binding domain-containing protein [Pseudomonas taiwanensis]
MHEITPNVLADLAPQGTLRVAINYGNPVLAQEGADGTPLGVSVALAKALADELGVELQMTTFDAAGKVFAALEQDAWRVAFLAIEPVRAAQIEFTEPYVLIEGTYLVRSDSSWQRVDELDQTQARIAVGRGAAYDLYLSRTLQNASLERADTSAGAVDLFIASGLDAAAGVRQPLEQFAQLNIDYRVLDGAFTAIRQAMAVPKGRDAGAVYVREFIERRLAERFVRGALLASGQTDVSAPR